MGSKDTELLKLDFSAAIERALWAAYHDGANQARRFGGSNRVILKEKAHLLKIHEVQHHQSLEAARREGRIAELERILRGYKSVNHLMDERELKERLAQLKSPGKPNREKE